MWHEDDLRSALRMLEREAPAAGAVLLHVTKRASAAKAGGERRRLPGGRLMAAAAASAAVIAVAAISLLATQPGGHSTAAASSALRSVPRYYLALVPASTKSNGRRYGIIRDTVTGKTLATIRPPKPFVTFTAVTGAADDRTFVLTAQTGIYGNQDTPAKFYSAHFNPADGALTISPLTIPDIPSINLAADALSPDGTRLAVAMSAGAYEQVKIYSLASDAVRVWQVGADPLSFAAVPVRLSWARSGILAFDWAGTYRDIRRHNRYRIVRESAEGSWLLNTAATGRGLLTDSRLAVCTPETSSAAFGYSGYLTPDGTNIIVPLTVPVKPGQRLRACVGRSQPKWEPASQATPKLEEFSATTSKAISVIYTSDSRSWVPTYDVFWSNSSGSVLVLDGPAGPGRGRPAKPGPQSQSVFGVLRGTKFTPIPGAPDPYTSTLAF